MASSYEERNIAAQEAGWDSLYYQTEGRREAREMFNELGIDADRNTIWEAAEFERDFSEGEYTHDELLAIFDDWFGEDGYTMDEFYAWVQDLYDE